MKRTLMVCVTAAVAAVSSGPVATAATTVHRIHHNTGAASHSRTAVVIASPVRSFSATLKLDSHYDWKRRYTPAVSTTEKLAKDSYEVATVSGVFSYYPARDYSQPKKPWPIVCGTPISSGRGPVGFDAEFIFARPWTTKACREHRLPMTWPNFQMNSGSYQDFTHPTVLGSWPTTPTANHTYSYAIVGHGRRLKFRLWDVYTRDNYGTLTIALRPATAADCSAFWSFGFKSYKACTRKLPAPTVI